MNTIQFKQYLDEMAARSASDPEMDKAFLAAQELGDTPILWRGQRLGRKIGRTVIGYGSVVKVTMEKESFKGAENPVVSGVMKALGFKQKPVFATFDKKQASFFGGAGIVIPDEPFTLLWNPDVHDSLVATKTDSFEKNANKIDAEVAEIVSGYSRSVNKIVKHHDGEILIDCKSYYWITLEKFFEYARKSKFNKYKTIDDIKTYQDVVNVFQGYKSYMDWYKNKLGSAVH